MAVIKMGTFWPRAKPSELSAFDPETKTCTHNCGPSANDPRSEDERKFLCDLCKSNKKRAKQ